MKERLNYLDISRGIAILLIVLGHCIVGREGILIKWIYSFHVVIFFIISGYLLNSKNIRQKAFKEVLTNRIKTLIIPYFVFSVIFIITDLLTNGISRLIWNIMYTILFVSPTALWFIPAFFIGEILFILTLRINKFHIKFSIVLGSFIVSYIVSLLEYNLIMLFLSRGLISYGFIAIGYCIKRYIDECTLGKAIILLIIALVTSLINPIIDLYSLKFGNLILYVFNGVTLSIGVIVISKKVSSNKLLQFLGRNTMIILGTHHWMTRLFVMNFPNATVITAIIAFIIIMIIEIPIIYLINNYTPWMLGKFNKKEINKFELG